MKTQNVKAAADFLSELQALEDDHGIYMKADRAVALTGTGDRPKNMGVLHLNGANRADEWWV